MQKGSDVSQTTEKCETLVNRAEHKPNPQIKTPSNYRDMRSGFCSLESSLVKVARVYQDILHERGMLVLGIPNYCHV